MANSPLRKMLHKVEVEMTREAKNIARKSIADAAKKSERLLSKTYDSIIEQYYEYETTSYYRHETGIGSKTGINLYRSNDIHLNNSILEISINADDMERYSRADANFVLDRLFYEGKRGGDVLLGDKPTLPLFTAYIKDDFGKRYSGKPVDVMKQITSNIEKEYFKTYFSRAWRKEVNTGKYNYFKKKGVFY